MNFPKTAGKYKRTRQSVMRAAATRGESRFTLGGREKKKKRQEPSLPVLKSLDKSPL